MACNWSQRVGGVVKWLVVSTTSDADLVAANTAKALRVTAAQLRFSAAGTITFKSGSTTVGVVQAEAAGTVVLPYNPDGWFETAFGAKLASSAGAITVSGTITYVEL